jgi:hypothetical protein
MRYQAISENVARFPVSLMCRCLTVSKAGFLRGGSARRARVVRPIKGSSCS